MKFDKPLFMCLIAALKYYDVLAVYSKEEREALYAISRGWDEGWL